MDNGVTHLAFGVPGGVSLPWGRCHVGGRSRSKGHQRHQRGGQCAGTARGQCHRGDVAEPGPALGAIRAARRTLLWDGAGGERGAGRWWVKDSEQGCQGQGDTEGVRLGPDCPWAPHSSQPVPGARSLVWKGRERTAGLGWFGLSQRVFVALGRRKAPGETPELSQAAGTSLGVLEGPSAPGDSPQGCSGVRKIQARDPKFPKYWIFSPPEAPFLELLFLSSFQPGARGCSCSASA